MKKTYITALIFMGLMPLLSNCASQQDVQNLNYHVRSINKKVTDMKLNTVDQMQHRQATSSGQLDQLQSDILQLKSKLDENAHTTRLLQEQNNELQLAIQNLSSEQQQKLDVKLAELDSKIATQKHSLTAIQQARVEDAERRSKAAKSAADAAMRKAKQASLAKTAAATIPVATIPAATLSSGIVHIAPTARKIVYTTSVAATPKPATIIKINPIASPAAPAATAAAVSTVVTKKPTPVVVQETVDSLENAQQRYRDGSYDEAYGLFEDNLSSNRSNKSTMTSRYMMGECLFMQGQYDKAIIQYQQVISSFPGNPQAAKALLRQGESFEQLSDTETARIIYKKIISSYASSPEAETAKSRASSL